MGLNLPLRPAWQCGPPLGWRAGEVPHFAGAVDALSVRVGGQGFGFAHAPAGPAALAGQLIGDPPDPVFDCFHAVILGVGWLMD